MDLIGIPLHIILGKRFEENREVEVKIRKTGERKYFKPENLENFVRNFENEKD
ncbi:MAG: proline--tRNA ligase, partial [Thermodesulfobacterium geofontis]